MICESEFCQRKENVRDSGPWKSNHVEEYYDQVFLNTLADLIGQAEMSQ